MRDRPNGSMIGASIVFKGELSADEDVVIEGQVEGNISLNQNVLTVGEHGKVKAKIAAKTVVVVGKVRDSIIAAENVDLRDTNMVEGDIYTSRLAMAAGAYVRGRIDIPQSQTGAPAGRAVAARADPAGRWRAAAK